jgi:hypothetical protein
MAQARSSRRKPARRGRQQFVLRRGDEAVALMDERN